jgi:hypothetical protein
MKVHMIAPPVMKVHMIVPPGHSSDPSTWAAGPVVGLKDVAVVDMSNSKHTSLQSMQVLHAILH